MPEKEKSKEIAVTDLRVGFVIVVSKGTKHEKKVPVRRLSTCRRGYVHVNAVNTEGRTKGGHGLCYDLISCVDVVNDDRTNDVPAFVPTVVLTGE